MHSKLATDTITFTDASQASVDSDSVFLSTLLLRVLMIRQVNDDVIKYIGFHINLFVEHCMDQLLSHDIWFLQLARCQIFPPNVDSLMVGVGL